MHEINDDLKVVKIISSTKRSWYEKKIGRYYAVEAEQEYPTNDWRVFDSWGDKIIREEDCEIVDNYVGIKVSNRF